MVFEVGREEREVPLGAVLFHELHLVRGPLLVGLAGRLEDGEDVELVPRPLALQEERVFESLGVVFELVDDGAEVARPGPEPGAGGPAGRGGRKGLEQAGEPRGVRRAEDHVDGGAREERERGELGVGRRGGRQERGEAVAQDEQVPPRGGQGAGGGGR